MFQHPGALLRLLPRLLLRVASRPFFRLPLRARFGLRFGARLRLGLSQRRGRSGCCGCSGCSLRLLFRFGPRLGFGFRSCTCRSFFRRSFNPGISLRLRLRLCRSDGFRPFECFRLSPGFLFHPSFLFHPGFLFGSGFLFGPGFRCGLRACRLLGRSLGCSIGFGFGTRRIGGSRLRLLLGHLFRDACGRRGRRYDHREIEIEIHRRRIQRRRGDRRDRRQFTDIFALGKNLQRFAQLRLRHLAESALHLA